MSIQDQITQSIIEAIEKGSGEFVMPWHKSGISEGIPHNPLSKNTYSGANVLVLWMSQAKFGYSTNKWATFKQWSAKGCTIRKGEKATHCAYYGTNTKTVITDTGDEESNSYLFAKPFFLFNADQVDGYQSEDIVKSPDLTERLANADQFIANTKAEIIEGGSRAFYRPSTDAIYMPDRWRFFNGQTSTATQAYYSTLLHELTHWSGSPDRLARTKGKFFGDPDYAFEELVAELGAAFLCASLGIENEPRIDHAQYVENWLKALKSDKKAIFSAASHATKAMAFMNELQSQTVSIAA